MRISGVSFDCAKTLLDVDWSPGRFGCMCARESGLEVPANGERIYDTMLSFRAHEYAWAARNGEAASAHFWRTLTIDWLTKLNLPSDPEPLVEAGQRLMFGPNQRIFKLYSDVLPCLAGLQERGIPMVVLSNWDDSLPRALDLYDLTKWFKAVFASMVEGSQKPEGRFFTLAERSLGLPPEEILHVGDNPDDDFQGALDAGFQALLLDREQPTDLKEGRICSLTEILGLPGLGN